MFYDRGDELLFEDDLNGVVLSQTLDALDLPDDEALSLIGRSMVNQTGFELPLEVQINWDEFKGELKEEIRKTTLGYIVGKLGMVRLLAEMAAYTSTGRVAPIHTKIAGRAVLTGVSAGAVGPRFIGPTRTPSRLRAARGFATGARITGRVLVVVGLVMTIADIAHLIRTGRFWGFQLFERPPIEIIMDGE